MGRSLNLIRKIAIAFLLICTESWATQTSLFWTNCITDVLELGRGDLDVDTYFTLFSNPTISTLPTDIGIEIGMLSIGPFSLEAGIDFFAGTTYPLYFNTKLGVKEDKLFRDSPSFSIGIYNVGTKNTGDFRTNQNVIDIVIGKTLPDFVKGRVFLGFYSGASTIGKNRQGWMAGYLANFRPALYCDGRNYYKWSLVADYASGKNLVGGGGIGVTYYFTPDVNLLTGPTWFNSVELNGPWKWTVQVNINFTAFIPPKKKLQGCY